MPIWLRNATFGFIKEFYDEEQKAYEKAQGKGKSSTTVIDSDGKVATPEFIQSKKTSYK